MTFTNLKCLLTIHFLSYVIRLKVLQFRGEMQCMSLIFSSYIFSLDGFHDIEFALPSAGFREYIDTFDGYSFKYSQNWIQV